MKTPLIAAALVLLLAACGKPADKPVQAPVAPATEATLPADAPMARLAWSASAAGIGPLTPSTSFDREAVAALFPGADVRNAYLSEEGVQVPVITVNGPEDLVLEIKQAGSTGRVGDTLVQGGPVVGPRGETLMAPWSSLGFKAADCVIGADRYSGAALCRRVDTPALAYVIGARGELAGRPGETPDADVLADKGFLREFLWQSPSPR
ncbi:MAG: DUF1131 domain-containing protein [Caulobacter sp.]|nr:DUF1131 domain-containing protein [Caulobacter sp.]